MRRIISILVFVLLQTTCFSAPIAYAADYNLKKMTPEVQESLLGRKGRFETLESYKQNGIIGENNRGYVELLSNDSTAENIVKMENADRKVIYQTIAQQNGISDQIDVIESVFAQVQREKASAGYKIQNADGNWTTK